MKYIVTSISTAMILAGALIIWVILTAFLLAERMVKLLIIAMQIIWHLRSERKWFKIMSYYTFVYILTIPITSRPLIWNIKNLKDYYLLQNWERIRY